MVRFPIPVRRIAAHLARGGLIAYPTESCYGLGCDPRNRNAVQSLLKLKQRPQRKGLILIASKYAQLSHYLQPLSPAEQATLQNDGAQAITYLMPAKSGCPLWLRGGHNTLAVRVTAHREAAALCRALNMALVSTSANRGGGRPARTWADCRRRFGRKALVLPGRVGRRKKPTTIRVWADGRIVRE
ncbi:MAG TPA: Sua5/YciO/YrdC/YwlC family protein [Gallionellaceae bacterium]|nr:Sua5/YciO/YrdC/YwlC family protein [Gallionellaceae bacterium]